MPGMADPNFSRTLTYICEHSADGALGLVVNRPTDMNLSVLFERLNLSLNSAEVGSAPVLFGGPVQSDRGFVLHQPAGEWSSSLKVRDNLALTTSKDILEAVGDGRGPSRMLLALGYSGWGAGQLEDEIKQNAWLTVPVPVLTMLTVASVCPMIEIETGRSASIVWVAVVLMLLSVISCV